MAGMEPRPGPEPAPTAESRAEPVPPPAVPAPPDRPKAWRLLALLLLVLTGWLGGLAWFVQLAAAPPADPGRTTDAIVVLTGGSERLSTGLALLAGQRAQKLFVSGVFQGVEVTELLRRVRLPADELACCIVLGHAADDTRGNARETAAWMEREGFRSLRLVTANYHMPRSLLEFHRALPAGVEILPHPVAPSAVHLDAWWRWPGTADLIITEYVKYLVALLRGPIAAAPPDPPRPEPS